MSGWCQGALAECLRRERRRSCCHIGAPLVARPPSHWGAGGGSYPFRNLTSGQGSVASPSSLSYRPSYYSYTPNPKTLLPEILLAKHPTRLPGKVASLASAFGSPKSSPDREPDSSPVEPRRYNLDPRISPRTRHAKQLGCSSRANFQVQGSARQAGICPASARSTSFWL